MTRVAYATDGEALSFRVHGQPGGTPVVTVHGLVSSTEHWSYFTPHFAQQRPVVSWDYRGHGGSPVPRQRASVTIPQFAHDARAVMRPTIDVPTLIIAGDKDQLTPVATAERMQRAIPRSELVVFPGHTHLVQVEKPREVHSAIDAFLARHAL